MRSSKTAAILPFVMLLGVIGPTAASETGGNAPLTRAGFVAFLYQMLGEPDVFTAPPFNDMPSGSPHVRAIAWAAENGVVNGAGGGLFMPDAPVTREQAAVIMLNYANSVGAGLVGAWAIRLDYTDLSEVSDWAGEAVMYSKMKGLIDDKPGPRFDPKGTVTQAEASVWIKRMLEAVRIANGGTNYADPDNWLALPDEIKFDADVIYFYPTTFTPEYEGELCTIDNRSMREGAPNSFASQATVFEPFTNIFAPFYRQIDAGTLAGKTQPEMIEAESGATREDVFAALNYYFENHNNGRPFFLAGHSQGAMMIYIILQDYMSVHPDRFENMIAAYMLGNAPTKDWLTANPHVKFAQGADDTGVLISWNAEGPGNIGKYSMVVPEGSVAINPLNWRTDETPAGIEENLGSFVDGEIVVPGIADARLDVERGSVIVESVEPAKFAMPPATEALFGPESYHGWDVEFFYMNIRENAALRLERFLNR